MPTRAEWARRKGRTSSWITKVRRLAVHLRDGFRCLYCWRDLHGAAPREVTLDHLNPRVNGGRHASSNLVTACARCNFGRRHVPWTRYATAEARARIERHRRRVPNVKLARAILNGTAPHPNREV